MPSQRQVSGELMGCLPGRRDRVAHVGLDLFGLVVQCALDGDGANIRTRRNIRFPFLIRERHLRLSEWLQNMSSVSSCWFRFAAERPASAAGGRVASRSPPITPAATRPLHAMVRHGYLTGEHQVGVDA